MQLYNAPCPAGTQVKGKPVVQNKALEFKSKINTANSIRQAEINHGVKTRKIK